MHYNAQANITNYFFRYLGGFLFNVRRACARSQEIHITNNCHFSGGWKFFGKLFGTGPGQIYAQVALGVMIVALQQ